MSIEEAILEKVRSLTPEKKAEVLQFLSGLEASGHPRFRSPKGILSDLNFRITEEDLGEARREMWSGFPRNDVA
ncbi:MAG TPA: hypothetical protein VIY49_14945 [Bryobacteraceae bacterium]